MKEINWVLKFQLGGTPKKDPQIFKEIGWVLFTF